MCGVPSGFRGKLRSGNLLIFCYSKADDWSAKNISGRVPKRKQDGKISY